jgi:acylphosphatase
MRVARRYLISGRVQGVGFRYFAQAAAVREELSGWVRNLPDGRVEVSAEGDHEQIARFEAQIRRGPRGAMVDQVDSTDVAPAHEAGFRIRGW